MENSLKFEKKRNKVKCCPCNRNNHDGKFVPYEGYIDKGYCFSCDRTFFPDKENKIELYQYKQQPEKSPSYHPLELVEKSGRNFKQNNFIQFLKSLFTEEEVKTAILKYLIGTSNHWNGSTVFWQIDHKQNVRHGKIMWYDIKTGKRLRRANETAYVSSVRSVLKLDDFNLKQCLFGLHLINDTKKTTIALVEGEKTAIIMSIFKPEYTWLATGGIGGLNWEYIQPLKGYKIKAFPDKNAYEIWKEKAIELRRRGLDISVSKFIEDKLYPNNTDLADIFIENMEGQSCKKKAICEIKSCNSISDIDMMVEKLSRINPAIFQLIDTFDLTDANGSTINTSSMMKPSR